MRDDIDFRGYFFMQTIHSFVFSFFCENVSEKMEMEINLDVYTVVD
jgi:hypothetical protein